MKLNFVFSTYPDVEWVKQLVPVVINNWGKIGVGVEVNYMDFNALSDAVYENHDFEMYTIAGPLPLTQTHIQYRAEQSNSKIW